MIIPDPAKKTVRIAVRFEVGGIVQLDRSPLPRLKAGTVGDLILPALDILDESDRKNLGAESLSPLLPEGSIVYVGLSPEMMDGVGRSKLRPPAALTICAGYLFAEVLLCEALLLRKRGYKDPCLEPCRCEIPVLKTTAKSLHHAFTLLSTAFEIERISHSGNVFERVFYRTPRGFRPLNEARGRI